MDSGPPKQPGRGKRVRRVILLALLILLGIIGVRNGYFDRLWRLIFPAPEQVATEVPPIPVIVANVDQKDVPIFLEGLGTVQALNTVNVHVRVDGQLEQVAFREGEEVREGQFLAKIDPAPFQTQLDQALAKKQQDEAQLANAGQILKRDAQLLAEKVISEQEYQTQCDMTAQFKAAVCADEAAVENARVQLGYTDITAPISGRIGIRIIDKGNIVHTSDPNGLIIITQIHPISGIFTLPEQDLPDVQDAMEKGTVKVYALGRNNGPMLGEGVLKVIDNQIDQTTATIRMKAEFPNKNNRLWPGQFISARVLLSVRKNSLVAPPQAIQRGPEGTYIFGILPDNTVAVRPVKVGQIQTGLAVIESGLVKGERIVVEGQYRLQTHSRVVVTGTKAPGETP